MAALDQPAPGSQIVERTGLALVHEGERIVAAPGSAAELVATSAQVVNYYFPVEVEVIGVGMRRWRSAFMTRCNVSFAH